MIDRTDTKFVIVSASGTPPAMDFGAYLLAGWYEGKRSRFWCPWHFVIPRTGVVEEGRSVQYRGAAPVGYKANSLTVLLVGGQSEGKYCKPEANYTANQYLALGALCDRLMARYPGVVILGANQVPGAAVLCNPGFSVSKWLSKRNIAEGANGTSNDAGDLQPVSQRGNLADLQAFHEQDRASGGGEPVTQAGVAGLASDNPHGVLPEGHV